MMRKHFYGIAILFFLGLSLIQIPIAAAADIEWQLRWLDNNMLQEEIQSSGRNLITTDPNWNVTQEGGKYILRREVNNWRSYGEMKDRVPLQVQQKNYILFKQTEIKPDSEIASQLFRQLSNEDNLRLTITVPGFIIGGSGERIDEASVRWTFLNHAELFQFPKMMTVITADGLVLSIGVFLLGILFVFFKFWRRLKKVNQIIAEEYSITKIKADDRKEIEQK